MLKGVEPRKLPLLSPEVAFERFPHNPADGGTHPGAQSLLIFHFFDLGFLSLMGLG
jgi:hypothetical protein